MLSEPIAVTLVVVEALERVGIPYVLVGSLASSVHGVMRSTLDADLLAAIELEHVEPLASELSDLFYADAETMRDAIRDRGSFNLIHLETAFKVDVFVAKAREFDQLQLSRREARQLGDDPQSGLYVTSAEDIILAKLEWYQLGGCASDRQWSDVLGVIQIQGNSLDLSYLRAVADTLGVLLLLEDALGNVT